MRIFKWYEDFVDEQKRDLPKGSRTRGWTVFGLWVMLIVPLFIIAGVVWFFSGLVGLLILLCIIVLIEIIFRLVDQLSK